MANLLKLQEILAKLKDHAQGKGDEVLSAHLKALEDEINTSFAAQEESDPPVGGNNPEAPDVP